jgi:hypothetical protein
MQKIIVSIVAVIVSLSTSLEAAVSMKIESSATVSWKSESGKFYRILGKTNITAAWDELESNIIGDTNVITRSYPMGNKAWFEVEEITQPNFTNRFISGQTFTTAPGALFQGATLVQSWFSNANLTTAHFEGAFIEDCHFEGANVSPVNFKDAQMNIVYFSNAQLMSSYFGGVSIFYGDFTGADLQNVLFTGATLILVDFTGAKNLNLEGARCVGVTLPDGTMRND